MSPKLWAIESMSPPKIKWVSAVNFFFAFKTPTEFPILQKEAIATNSSMEMKCGSEGQSFQSFCFSTRIIYQSRLIVELQICAI